MFEVGQHRRKREGRRSARRSRYIQSLGVENIQAHRQPLLKKLRDEMPRLGFTPVTPPESTSPIITFAMKDGAAVQKKLDAAKVNARVRGTGFACRRPSTTTCTTSIACSEALA